MNRQNIQESEQVSTTEGQVMPSCKERMILLFNWTILEGDCHFVEEFPIMNYDESTTTRVNVGVQRKSEKLY